LLFAALCWAANIVYVRSHNWISTPFQLLFWQALLATVLLAVISLVHDGVPHIVWSGDLVGGFLFAGVIGTALAHWAMVLINRSLPATVTSLGLLATPGMGVTASALLLGESVSLSLLSAMAMILGGIALGTMASGRPDTARRSRLGATSLSVGKRKKRAGVPHNRFLSLARRAPLTAPVSPAGSKCCCRGCRRRGRTRRRRA
jgi:drug/metabolite transporter (DMT)-like permease